VELRATTGRLRATRLKRAYLPHLVRLLAFWVVPVLLVLSLAYVVASRG